jgi:general secretion pathway protein G
VLELLLVVALIVTTASISIPSYTKALEKARTTRAIGDIKNISTTISLAELQTGQYPDSLADVGLAGLRDPWGQPYEYLRLMGTKNHGKCRKDKKLNPINSDFDLYSVGPDGSSSSPLTAKQSRDDVVRGNNGGFVGVAADY